MTKRSHASITPSHAEPPERQASYDGDGSHEDGDGSSLKKPRSFMATLVSRIGLMYEFVLTLAGM